MYSQPTTLPGRVANERILSLLAPKGLPKANPAATTVRGETVVRQQWLDAVVDALANLSGFQVSQGLRAKVVRIFHGLSDQELERNVRNLMANPIRHPAWQSLVEEITVHETYFFRDPQQLELVWREILPEIIERERRRAKPQIRIWSAATSTGEEAYTLAMLVLQYLLDAGEARWAGGATIDIDPRWDIEILGTDISRKVLDQARSGLYLQSGSIGPLREFPERFRGFMEFNLPPSLHRAIVNLPCALVKPCVRKLVRWDVHNLLEETSPNAHFDLVFCRNVLVYFDDAAKIRVQRKLHRVLNPNGCLFLGPADLLLLQEQFRTRHGAQAIYYRKTG